MKEETAQVITSLEEAQRAFALLLAMKPGTPIRIDDEDWQFVGIVRESFIGYLVLCGRVNENDGEFAKWKGQPTYGPKFCSISIAKFNECMGFGKSVPCSEVVIEGKE